jgi:hypothetical protein
MNLVALYRLDLSPGAEYIRLVLASTKFECDHLLIGWVCRGISRSNAVTDAIGQEYAEQ